MHQVPPTAFFHNSAGRLSTDPRGFVRIVWHPNGVDAAARRELLEQLLEELMRLGTGKVLADQRYMKPFTLAEQCWVNEDWTPRAVVDAGYRCRAILAPHDAVARLVAAGVVAAAREHISYCYFDNESEAIAWLLAQ